MRKLRLPLGPAVIDVVGSVLTDDDRRRLRHPAAGGVILFARNYENPEQLTALTDEIARRTAEDSTPKPACTLPPPDEQEEITADDPLLTPVEGVTLEMVARIHAAIAARSLPAGEIDAVATAAGVPDGRWESVLQVWRRRIVTSPALARRFRVARDEARRELG